MSERSLSYPIGPDPQNSDASPEQIKKWIADIESFPFRLAAQCEGTSIEQLNWPYRPGGWTLKQLVHHCADSHLNSIMRFKLALTEEQPTIKPYYEDRWALSPEAQDDDISNSLKLIEALHHKWVAILKSISPQDWARSYIHPEHGRAISLKEALGSYAWHCNHHLAHFAQGLRSAGSYK